VEPAAGGASTALATMPDRAKEMQPCRCSKTGRIENTSPVGHFHTCVIREPFVGCRHTFSVYELGMRGGRSVRKIDRSVLVVLENSAPGRSEWHQSHSASRTRSTSTGSGSILSRNANGIRDECRPGRLKVPSKKMCYAVYVRGESVEATFPGEPEVWHQIGTKTLESEVFFEGC
jgi:hypothetical protein